MIATRCLFMASARRAAPKLDTPKLLKTRRTVDNCSQNLQDISNFKYINNSVTDATIHDLDPSKIDTQIPAMNKMWTKLLLIEYCKHHNLPFYGRKLDIIKRIRKYWGITGTANYSNCDIQLSPAEFFLVRGGPSKSQNIEHIKSICNVDITLDAAMSQMSLRGEVQAVLKAKELIREAVSNIHTHQIQIPQSWSGNGKWAQNAVENIKTMSGAFAIVDQTENRLLVAATTKDILVEAKQVFDDMQNVLIENETKSRRVFLNLPNVDIGPSLAFYPVSDMQWNLYHRKLTASRLEKLSDSFESHLNDKKEHFFVDVQSSDDKVLNANELVSSMLLKNAKSSSSDCTVAEVTIGKTLIFDKLTPYSSFVSDLELLGSNISVSFFREWFNSSRPFLSFINNSVSYNYIKTHLKPLNIISQPPINLFTYSNETECATFNPNGTLISRQDLNTKDEFVFMNVSGRFDCKMAVINVREPSSELTINCNNPPVKVSIEGKEFKFEGKETRSGWTFTTPNNHQLDILSIKTSNDSNVKTSRTVLQLKLPGQKCIESGVGDLLEFAWKLSH